MKRWIQLILSFLAASAFGYAPEPNLVFQFGTAGQVTNIAEKATNNFPVAFFTLNWTNAGRVQWEFVGPLPHAYTPPARTNTFEPHTPTIAPMVPVKTKRWSSFSATNTSRSEARVAYI